MRFRLWASCLRVAGDVGRDHSNFLWRLRHNTDYFYVATSADSHFPLVFSQTFLGTRLARYSGSVAYRSAFSLPGKCLTGRPFRLTVHQLLGGPWGPGSIGITS